MIKNITNSTQFVSTGTTLNTDIQMVNQGYSLIPINWQIDNYLLLTAQLGSTLDIANGTGLVIDCPQAE
jgi:anti-anti-sigma regulatory factor